MPKLLGDVGADGGTARPAWLQSGAIQQLPPAAVLGAGLVQYSLARGTVKLHQPQIPTRQGANSRIHRQKIWYS